MPQIRQTFRFFFANCAGFYTPYPIFFLTFDFNLIIKNL